MSLFTSSNVTCPLCREVVNTSAAGSINADRRPDFREDIMNNRFQDISCPNCGTDFRLEPDFNYLDVGHGQWIAGFPARRIDEYDLAETEAQEIYDASYGPGARPAAQDVGQLLTMRVTFGWPAVREKLLIRDLGLDDVTIELTKLDIMRRLPEATLAPGIELRLAGMDGPMMSFVWIDAESEDIVQSFSADRALYDAITDKAADWAPMGARVSAGPFVDMQRLYLSDTRPVTVE